MQPTATTETDHDAHDPNHDHDHDPNHDPNHDHDHDHDHVGSEPDELRRRAGHLVRLAAEIEQSLVMTLTDRTGGSHRQTSRARLCEAMLERNLHQLHRAADDLRLTAFRFTERADHLAARAAA